MFALAAEKKKECRPYPRSWLTNVLTEIGSSKECCIYLLRTSGDSHWGREKGVVCRHLGLTAKLRFSEAWDI